MNTDYEERLRRVETELAELRSAVQELLSKNGAVTIQPSANWGKFLRGSEQAIHDRP